MMVVGAVKELEVDRCQEKEKEPSPSRSAMVELLAVRVWYWVGVPESVRDPVGLSLTLATRVVGDEARDSAVPRASV